jgi:hypothetical protein
LGFENPLLHHSITPLLQHSSWAPVYVTTPARAFVPGAGVAKLNLPSLGGRAEPVIAAGEHLAPAAGRRPGAGRGTDPAHPCPDRQVREVHGTHQA